MPWWSKALAVLALFVGTWLHGHHAGAEAERIEAQLAADAQAEQQRLLARAAAAGYEIQRAAFNRRALAQPLPEFRNALHAPVCPPAGPNDALELGDVPVPAAVLQRLRDAGADF